jgi:hypothetical protein
MDLAGIHFQVDALQDFAIFDSYVQICDFQQTHSVCPRALFKELSIPD